MQKLPEKFRRTIVPILAHNVLMVIEYFSVQICSEHVTFPYHDKTNRNRQFCLPSPRKEPCTIKHQVQKERKQAVDAHESS